MTKNQSVEQWLKEKSTASRALQDGIKIVPEGFDLVKLSDALYAIKMAREETVEKIFKELENEFERIDVGDGFPIEQKIEIEKFDEVKKRFLESENK